jgi:hypothetical protein
MKRLADVRKAATELAAGIQREVHELRGELTAAETRLAVAQEEEAYWASVREMDEVLRLCLQRMQPADATQLTDAEHPVAVFSVPVSVRELDGQTVYTCMATLPCPVHGRPLGDSDWRLHPVNRGVITCPAHGLEVAKRGQACPRCMSPESQGPAPLCPAHRCDPLVCAAVGRACQPKLTFRDVPATNADGSQVLCSTHNIVLMPGEQCPMCDVAGMATTYERRDFEHLPRPVADL